jgi:predicted nucleic-acid-binding protein
VKVTPDTNLLVRAIVRDNERQAEIAARTLRQAEVIALTLPALCEFVWVLRSIYRFERQDLEVALRTLLEIRNVALDRPAVEAGLASLQAGADFADGLIAHEGRRLGGEVFVSFDKKAVKIAMEQRQKAKLAT